MDRSLRLNLVSIRKVHLTHTHKQTEPTYGHKADNFITNINQWIPAYVSTVSIRNVHLTHRETEPIYGHEMHNFITNVNQRILSYYV